MKLKLKLKSHKVIKQTFKFEIKPIEQIKPKDCLSDYREFEKQLQAEDYAQFKREQEQIRAPVKVIKLRMIDPEEEEEEVAPNKQLEVGVEKFLNGRIQEKEEPKEKFSSKLDKDLLGSKKNDLCQGLKEDFEKAFDDDFEEEDFTMLKNKSSIAGFPSMGSSGPSLMK